jgi:hypothetical protein
MPFILSGYRCGMAASWQTNQWSQIRTTKSHKPQIFSLHLPLMHGTASCGLCQWTEGQSWTPANKNTIVHNHLLPIFIAADRLAKTCTTQYSTMYTVSYGSPLGISLPRATYFIFHPPTLPGCPATTNIMRKLQLAIIHIKLY